MDDDEKVALTRECRAILELLNRMASGSGDLDFIHEQLPHDDNLLEELSWLTTYQLIARYEDFRWRITELGRASLKESDAPTTDRWKECAHEQYGIIFNPYNQAWSCHRCGLRFHAPVAWTEEDYLRLTVENPGD